MQPLDGPHGYHRMREAQERELAAKAKDNAARLIHLDLAERYRQLSEGSDFMP